MGVRGKAVSAACCRAVKGTVSKPLRVLREPIGYNWQNCSAWRPGATVVQQRRVQLQNHKAHVWLGPGVRSWQQQQQPRLNGVGGTRLVARIRVAV